jgi:hypothetical protein
VDARGAHSDRAESLVAEAVELSSRSDALNLRGDALLDLADVQRALGHDREAADSLRRALALYEQKGNVVSARAANVALIELDA